MKTSTLGLAATLIAMPGLALAGPSTHDVRTPISSAAVQAAKGTGVVKPEGASDCTFLYAAMTKAVGYPTVRVFGLDEAQSRQEATERMHAWGLVTLREAKRAGVDAASIKGPKQTEIERVWKANNSTILPVGYGVEDALRKCDGMMYGHDVNDFNVRLRS